MDQITEQPYEKSFWVIVGFLFLLPIFFIPAGILDIEISKSLLLSIGVVVATITFLLETWKQGVLSIPWHPFVIAIILLPIIYLASALVAVPSSLSLFGYNFEVGTFGYMLIVTLLLIIISIIFDSSHRVLQALLAFLASFSLVVLFVVIKILSGGSPVWGIFNGVVANPIGRWTDLALALGLIAIFAMLALGMIPMKKSLKCILYGLFLISVILLATVNFSVAFILTLGASIVALVYFLVVEKHFYFTTTSTSGLFSFLTRPVLLPIILGLISILFLLNPTISETRGKLGDWVSSVSGVTNIEVRPSFSATLTISKAALAEDVLFGTGPNTFGRDWLIHKPVEVNSTPFWSTSFPFGVGFIPTQIASIGILGVIVWLAFFGLLLFVGIRTFLKISEPRALRFALVSTYITIIYLWAASFMYSPSIVLLTLTIIFTGLFLGLSRETGVVSFKTFPFSQDAKIHFLATALIVLLSLGSLGLGFIALNKVRASYYFQEALNLSNKGGESLDSIEQALKNANSISPTDISQIALSRVYFTKAQTAAADTKGTAEGNRAIFQDAISKSIAAAKEATVINPTGYQNWIALGTIYATLVPPPLSVPGAYENAKVSFEEAKKRHPSSPEVPLIMARLELSHSSGMETARSLVRESLVLKEDYADAYVLLAQIELQAHNIKKAIESAERVAQLIPGNPGIYFELGLLKYSDKDYNGAAGAFAAALTVVPEYANAQYYFGLSLIQLNEFDLARQQFEALEKTNPDNQEIKAILGALKTGKKPI